jgi:hypothetical protein
MTSFFLMLEVKSSTDKGRKRYQWVNFNTFLINFFVAFIKNIVNIIITTSLNWRKKKKRGKERKKCARMYLQVNSGVNFYRTKHTISSSRVRFFILLGNHLYYNDCHHYWCWMRQTIHRKKSTYILIHWLFKRARDSHINYRFFPNH